MSLIIRINPKQCNYKNLKIEDEFSSKSTVFQKKYDIKVGNLLFTIASGKDRDKGVLGIWRIIKKPFQKESEKLDSYTQEYKEERKIKQWRIRAKLLRNISEDNLELIKDNFRKELKLCFPVLLSEEKTKLLLDLLKDI